MLKDIFDGLEELGVLDNTYVIFSSDNGYHLGSKKMPFGKSHPYETDIRLPMYIRGPNVKKNETKSHPTNHVDISATIVDIANAHDKVSNELDGLSFKNVLSEEKDDFRSWRNHSYTEFF